MRDPELSRKVTSVANAHDLHLIEAPAGEPDLDKLMPVMARVAEIQPDWIVAIGGGSVLDAGKLLWIFYEHPDVELERIARPFALAPLRGKARFAAVPTTAGTGSEVSSSAILTDSSGQKIAIVSHDLLPDVVILDPTLTVGVPRATLAAAGLDALAHALEGFASRFANPLADTFAESAARTLFNRLTETVNNPENLDTRLDVMQAALMAGWVQNLKVPGVGHAIAHQLGRFGVAHGAAAGALLAPAMGFNCGDGPTRRKYDRLGRALGFEGAGELRDEVIRLRAALGAAASLETIVRGGRAALLSRMDEITRGALSDPCARANPRTVDGAAIRELLEAAC